MPIELSPDQRHLLAMEKAQIVRLWDVFFLGPLMMYVGAQKKVGKEIGLIMTLAGLGTIAFNGYNYLQIHEYTKGKQNADSNPY